MKKAQLQIMENIFVIIIIFIILIIAFVFYITFQSGQEKQKLEEAKQLEVLRKSQMFAFLPELQCSDNNNIDPDCYDMQKIESFIDKKMYEDTYYIGIFGNIQIVIKMLDLSGTTPTWSQEWVVYDHPKSPNKGTIPAYFPILLRDSITNTNHFGAIYMKVYQ